MSFSNIHDLRNIERFFQILDVEADDKMNQSFPTNSSNILIPRESFMDRVVMPMSATELKSLYEEGLNKRYLADYQRARSEKCRKTAWSIIFIFGAIGVSFCKQVRWGNPDSPIGAGLMCIAGGSALLSAGLYALLVYCNDSNDRALKDLASVVNYAEKNPRWQWSRLLANNAAEQKRATLEGWLYLEQSSKRRSAMLTLHQ